MKLFICRKCGCTAAVIHQPPTHPTQPASQQVTCWTKMCGNYGQTKDTRDTTDIDELFTVEDDNTAPDDLQLELLFRNAQALKRLKA